MRTLHLKLHLKLSLHMVMSRKNKKAPMPLLYHLNNIRPPGNTRLLINLETCNVLGRSSFLKEKDKKAEKGDTTNEMSIITAVIVMADTMNETRCKVIREDTMNNAMTRCEVVQNR